MVKVEDEYQCHICDSQFVPRMAYKRHVFEQHTEDEVQNFYQRSVLKEIGNCFLKRIRSSVLHKIELGQWQSYTMSILVQKSKLDTTGFDYRRKIEQADDDYESWGRRAINTTQMQILWKLAVLTEFDAAFATNLLPLHWHCKVKSCYLWSIEGSMDRELEPVQITEVIRLTRKAKRKKLRHIPHFQDLCQSDTTLYIEASTLPICFRDVLQDRGLMAAEGWYIVLGLLEAYQELQKVKATLRTISPASIYLSKDCRELIFADLAHLIWHEGSNLTIPTMCMPYSNANLLGY